MASHTYLLCLMFLFGLGFAQDFSCFDNLQECANRLQSLMLDNSAFTFGANYTEMCSWNPPPGNCVNQNVNEQSMYAKIFNTTNSADLINRVRGLSVLSVTYNAPKESYKGCGHMFDIPGINRVTVDPLRDFRYSMKSFTYRPEITWPVSDPNDLYTVIIYDVQFSFLHGMYINCRGGSWDNCETAWRYLAPGFFMPAENVYTFMLFRQINNQILSLTQVQASIQQYLTPDAPGVPFLGLFSFPPFFYSYQYILGNPVALSVLRVYGDPYNAQEVINRGALNVCPWFITQLDAFHEAVEYTGMQVALSNPKYTESLYSSNSYLTSVTVNIEVMYESGDFEWQSCCNDFSLSQGVRTVDPFSDEPIPGVVTRNKPRVRISPIALDWRQYDAMRSDTYVFLMIDVTRQGETDDRIFLHWAVTDIKNADVTTGTAHWEYFQPAPMSTGNYMFLLFNQTVPTISSDALRTVCPNGPTCRTNLQTVLNAFGVSNPLGVTFFQVTRDSYIDLLYYDVYKAVTEHEVCRGREGYDNPCPPRYTDLDPSIFCSNSANIHFNRLFAFGLSLLTIVTSVMFKKL